jgi:glycine C-acetyltransferase
MGVVVPKTRPVFRALATADFIGRLESELKGIEEAGTWKKERVIVSTQESEITVASGAHVLNFCANNYLGLSNDPRVNEAAKKTIEKRGFGLSSVRFICGTQDIHIALEEAIAKFHNMDAAILYPSW